MTENQSDQDQPVRRQEHDELEDYELPSDEDDEMQSEKTEKANEPVQSFSHLQGNEGMNI